MSVESTGQLYNDLTTICRKGGGQFAEPNVLRLFNANLAEAKKAFPNDPILGAINDAVPGSQVRYEDLLVRTGQIRSRLDESGAPMA